MAGDKGLDIYRQRRWRDPYDRLYNMAKSAACDTIFRGGTFVLVVTDKKVTMIQQPDAEEI